VALVPWFTVLLRDRGAGHRGPGYTFGMTYFVAGLWWLAHLHPLFPFGLSAILALYPLLFACLFRKIAALGRDRALLLLPPLWIAVDYLREHLASGFPWLLPGHALAAWSNLRQAADLGGEHLLGLLLVTVNAGGAAMLARREGRLNLLLLPAAILAVVPFTIYGSVRRRGIHDRPGPRVLLVQPSFPQSIKREAMSSIPRADEMRDIQLALSIQAARAHLDADLVVWAETMVPGEMREHSRAADRPDAETTVRLHNIVDPVGVVPGGTRRFLGGALLRDPDKGLRNAALLVGPGGRIEGRFDKSHLTPFGEYLPFLSVLPVRTRDGIEDWVRTFSPIPRLAPGGGGTVALALPGGRTVRLGGLVCYEVIFPEISRARLREGADVLVNLSNYAWYGAGMREQILDVTRLRAVETRRPVVVATNDGPTAVLDGNGEVRTRLAEGARAVLSAEVALDGRGTLYARIGDLVAWLAAAAALAGVGAGIAASRRRPPEGRETS
jgi:apolipoprotein N-acyltransferase